MKELEEDSVVAFAAGDRTTDGTLMLCSPVLLAVALATGRVVSGDRRCCSGRSSLAASALSSVGGAAAYQRIALVPPARFSAFVDRLADRTKLQSMIKL